MRLNLSWTLVALNALLGSLIILRRGWVRCITALPGPQPRSALLGHLANILSLPRIDGMPLVMPFFEAQMKDHAEQGFFHLRMFSPWLPFVSRVRITHTAMQSGLMVGKWPARGKNGTAVTCRHGRTKP